VLLAMTFVLLPVLPNRTVDSYGSFNPHELWLMTVLIAAVQFAGYVAVRVLGAERGVLLSAVAGSLVSSTTVTINNSHLAKESGADTALFAASICVAWIVSLVRMTAIAAVVNPSLLQPLALPVGAAASVLLAAAGLYMLRMHGAKVRAKIDFRNPLDIPFVLRFGALLAVIMVGAKLLSGLFGNAGLFGLAGVSGFADVDPITLSAAKLVGTSITARQGAESILLAAAANMITKIVVPIVTVGVRFGAKLALAGGLGIAAGGAALALTGG